MVAECSGVGVDLDVEAIVPPANVSLSRWLKTFPSYGLLLATERSKADALISVFRERDLDASVIGEVNSGSEAAFVAGPHRAVIRDWRLERLLGFAPVEECAA